VKLLASPNGASRMPDFSSLGTIDLGDFPKLVSVSSSSSSSGGSGSGSSVGGEVAAAVVVDMVAAARGCSECACLPKGSCADVNAALCPRMDHHVCSKKQEDDMALERKRENKRLKSEENLKALLKTQMKMSKNKVDSGIAHRSYAII
jgi:hypothetical protein